jgi:hypothetical protein
MIREFRIDFIRISSGFSAEQIAKWIHDRADVHVRQKEIEINCIK